MSARDKQHPAWEPDTGEIERWFEEYVPASGLSPAEYLANRILDALQQHPTGCYSRKEVEQLMWKAATLGGCVDSDIRQLLAEHDAEHG